MPPTTLATAVNAILDGLVTYLKTEQRTGGTLSDVIVIARGDRASPSPEVPAVYLVPQKMIVVEPTTSQSEWWEMPVNIGTMVNSDIPEIGYTAATDLAARARALLLTHNSRNIGLDYIKIIKSSTFDPAGPWSRAEGNYHTASAEVKVLFKIRG
ncbi:MAG: hypothetical protein WC262_07035 [Bacteroidales bacterium]|jgi:hypothetical protein